MAQSEAGRRLDERYAAGEISEDEYARFRDRLREAEAATAPRPAQPPPFPSEPGFFEHLWRGEIGPYKGRLAFFGIVVVLVLVVLNIVMPSPPGTQTPTQNRVPEAGPAPVSPPSGQGGYSDAALDALVTAVNKSAPQAVSSDRRFDSVTRIGRILVYTFTELDQTYYTTTDRTESERQATVRFWCGDPDRRQLLFSLTYVAVHLKFSNDMTILTYHVSGSDCR